MVPNGQPFVNNGKLLSMRETERTEFGARLLAARTRAGMSQMDVREALGISQGTLSQIERVAETSRYTAHLAALYKCSAEWLATGRGEPDFLLYEDGKPVTVVELKTTLAHQLSEPTPTFKSQRIEWGDVMKEPLPNSFELVVRDDAMAPLLEPGNIARFSTNAAVRPGKRVLIVDRDGAPCIREYRAKRGERWQAVALNAAYEPMDSVDDGLRVLAVLVGVDWE